MIVFQVTTGIRSFLLWLIGSAASFPLEYYLYMIFELNSNSKEEYLAELDKVSSEYSSADPAENSPEIPASPETEDPVGSVPIVTSIVNTSEDLTEL
mmetsp:Transcript_42034/g.64400  ORF Transcript_42034/g.64400 Transcript_42034/m.64400 type:complete len:97 (+) Transcript_42034:835-1125(+)